MSQIKDIKTIVLNKDEVLAKWLQDLEGQDAAIRNILLDVDKTAVNLSSYDRGVLDDINRGHWDIYRHTDETKNTVSIHLKSKITARSPRLDVKNGTVAIDFGTKSTVAGLIDENSRKSLFRIGSGDIKRADRMDDYENPTVIEFMDLRNFYKAYHSTKSRPLTQWNDVCVSHAAANGLLEAENEDFYRFFSKLKQWAGTSENKIRIKDKNESYDLKDFEDCKERDINPIEIYAYYIARYINNMNEGIYLNYLLSYPVKYSKEVREQIRISFERGIRKALPFAVLCASEDVKQLSVELSASEPAAYAISALQEYGFYDEKFVDEQIYYGVFDFGGGTTDFDFGIWRGSEQGRYDFEIKHFGAEGAKFLGGENLLELLAYEVFKDNKEVMREKNCSFTKPSYEAGFGGDEGLIQNSQEARKNTAKLANALRPFWENIKDFLDESNSNALLSEIKRGEIKVGLIDNEGKMSEVPLKVDATKLLDILRAKIKDGVDSFFYSLWKAFNKISGIEKIHIFLGGNASRSPLVEEEFERKIAEERANFGEKLEFELFPPLGTPAAEEKRAELGLKVDANTDFSTKATCKTGVVFGLLDGRKTGRIHVLSEIRGEDEAKFNFYLGEERFKKFKILIDKDKHNVSEDWIEFCNYANVDAFELLYTAETKALTGDLELTKVKRKRLLLDKVHGEEDSICIQLAGVNKIRYAVFKKGKGGAPVWESEEVELSE